MVVVVVVFKRKESKNRKSKKKGRPIVLPGGNIYSIGFGKIFVRVLAGKTNIPSRAHHIWVVFSFLQFPPLIQYNILYIQIDESAVSVCVFVRIHLYNIYKYRDDDDDGQDDCRVNI